MTRTAAFAALAFAVAPAAPALAEKDATHSVAIDLSGYDLTTMEGGEMVYRMIRKAARSACGVTSGRKDLRLKAAEDACMEEAIENAVASMTAASVRTAHARHGGAG
ncbi:MAG: UrcA family protein [Pseudomonadota bacterium]